MVLLLKSNDVLEGIQKVMDWVVLDVTELAVSRIG